MPRWRGKEKPAPIAVMSADSDSDFDQSNVHAEDRSASSGIESDESFYGDNESSPDGLGQGSTRYTIFG